MLPPLMQAKGLEEKALRQEIAPNAAALPKDIRETAISTALTIRILQVCFADREDQWRLAVAKALRWLGKVAPEVKAWAEKAGVAGGG